MDGQAGSAQMPQYQSHKKVWALKIATVEDHPGDAENVTLVFADSKTYAPRLTARAVVSRYMPKAGDYFVVYDDGYESISPAKAFEEGYTRI
jgi:hypothetical protein